jgi:TPP-dependent pyruvate/acetoin dehydrogenase alpha subunit
MIQAPDANDLYRQMLRIRRFEETALEAFGRGVIRGTTHTYIGQEADAAGVLAWRQPGDVIGSNHRCHGHFLAARGSMHALAAELMGRATGVCGGRGGSQHLHLGDFYANGVLGGTVPLALGMAFAEKVRHSGKIVIAFLGDGSLGQGVVYESLNMASLWHLPLLLVVEDNRYAQTTPISLNLAGSIPGRFQAFGIPVDERDTTDVLEIHALAGPAFERVRGDGGPRALVLHTYRFASHSKGDDTRDPAEVARYRQRDPIPLHGARIPADERARLEAEVEAEVAEAFRQAEADPPADPAVLTPLLETV